MKAAGEETEIEDRLGPAIEQPVDQPESTQSGYERLEKGLSAVSAGLVRLERKLDRILALSIESRGRNRP